MPSSSPIVEVYNESNEDIPLSQGELEEAILHVSENEGQSLRNLEIVFVDEKGIVEINNSYLDRDYVTDIISFGYNDENRSPGDHQKFPDPEISEGIEGTLYCCAPRIAEQAKEFDEPVKKEFLRIVIHGLLHLMGYADHNEQQKFQMRKKENGYLAKLKY